MDKKLLILMFFVVGAPFSPKPSTNKTFHE
jgi:hypothetical protein